MEKMQLSAEEKAVLRMIGIGANYCPEGYAFHRFVRCVKSLERKGLVMVAWASGHELAYVELSDDGIEYLACNYSLRNPVDWRWVITTIISLIGVAIAIIALFVACSIHSTP